MAKRTLYVGGLEESVTPAKLTAAFIPFGDITQVEIPVDPGTQKSRGFGFVVFEDADDAADAIQNMDNAEFFGRVLRVNHAKPLKPKSNRAVWAQSDDYYKQQEGLKAAQQEGAAAAAAAGAGGAGAGVAAQ